MHTFKKIACGLTLTLLGGLVHAGEIPSQFRGDWGGNTTNACTADESSDLLTVDNKTLSELGALYTLTGNDKTSFGGEFSGKFKFEGEEETNEDTTVKLKLTETGKLLMNGDRLFTKCSADEIATRQAARKETQLKHDMLGVWSDVGSGRTYTFFTEDSDKIVALIDNNDGPYAFHFDSVDSKNSAITFAQRAGESNAVWTMKLSDAAGSSRYATLITSEFGGDNRHRLSFVRDTTYADDRLLADARSKTNQSPSKKGKTAHLISPPTNIRSEPSGSIVCVVSEAKDINILGAKAGDDGSVWYKTDVCGQAAYVKSSQLKFN